MFFCLFVFFLNLFGLSMVYFKEGFNFQRFQRGSMIFQGGPTFSRGVQMLISVETHITCDSREGQEPLFPLWIRTYIIIY